MAISQHRAAQAGAEEVRAAETTNDSYPLRVVSRLTGLSADVIRAWEKRYGVVTPMRGPRGARIYSATEVNHLRALARVVASGRSIGDVANLPMEALEGLVAPAESSARSGIDEQSDLIERALHSVQRLDSTALNQQLGDALMALGSIEFVRTVVSPLLTEVGDRWNSGDLSMAAEHFVSGLLRNLLSGLLRNRAAERVSTVLLATPSGERHEFGLLIAALLIADAGVGVCYLGVDLPAAEIAAASRCCDASVVALGLSNEDNRAAAIHQVGQVERALPQQCELWLGGQEAAPVALELSDTRGLVLDDIDKMQGEISRLRDRLIAAA